MSQHQLQQPYYKEIIHRPHTRAESIRPTLALSSNNITLTRNHLPNDTTYDYSKFKRFHPRNTTSENNSGEYLYQKLLKYNVKQLNINRPDTKFKEDIFLEEVGISKTKKLRGLSIGQNLPINKIDYSTRPMTTQNLNDKFAYFDQLSQSAQILKEYKMMSHIGKGAFSIVSLAINKETRKEYAIKAYEKVDAIDWNRLACIKRQVKHLKQLDNERVVKLIHLIKERRKLYLIMQNAGKQSLAGIFRKERTITEMVAKRYFKEIIEGVAYCHEQGISHRDLKPQNILIDDKGRVKLIDFGFSASSKILLNQFCGTPAYMCPEIVKKLAYNGAKADIWALGIILYLILVGHFPFRAGNQPELNRLITAGKYRYREEGLISNQGKKIIARMLQIKPELRPTARELLQDPWLNYS